MYNTIEDNHKRFLNELDDFQYRVFILHFAFKNTQEQISKDLHKDKNTICKTCQQLKTYHEFESVRGMVLDIIENQLI